MSLTFPSLLQGCKTTASCLLLDMFTSMWLSVAHSGINSAVNSHVWQKVCWMFNSFACGMFYCLLLKTQNTFLYRVTLVPSPMLARGPLPRSVHLSVWAVKCYYEASIHCSQSSFWGLGEQSAFPFFKTHSGCVTGQWLDDGGVRNGRWALHPSQIVSPGPDAENSTPKLQDCCKLLQPKAWSSGSRCL